MIATIQKWGNSQGIRLPKHILDMVKFAENEQIDISADNDKIVITKARPHKTIKERFKDYKGDYKPEYIDWGEPQGREVW